jgi:hypothetical protein
MRKGPQGRPADVIEAATMVAKIATGEIEEKLGAPVSRAPEQGAANVSPQQRSEIAKKAAQLR